MLRSLGILLLSFSVLEAQRRCFKLNEVWMSCSSRCEPTCDNQNPACVRICDPPSCQCNRGFFRDAASGECLNKNQCSRPPFVPTCATMRCAPMQQCTESGERARCIPIPTDPVGPTGPMCSTNSDCPSGMVCMKGRYGLECKDGPMDPPLQKLTCDNVKCSDVEYCTEADGSPKCVPLSTDPIPPSGPMCSVHSDCPPGMSCIEKTCAPIHVDPGKPSITCENLKCRDGEYCENGTNEAKCVKAPIDPMFPSKDNCGKNEVWNRCPTGCTETNCGEEKFAKACSFVCGTPKCQCAEGFLRENKYSNTCVLPSNCPPPIESTTTERAVTTTDNAIPCGDTSCHPAWTCQRITVPCTRSPCEPDAFFCMAPHTVPPPDCDGEYCSPSETCETLRVSCTLPPCPPDRKQCVPLPGATSPPAPILPSSCGPDGMVCNPGETCQVAMASCARQPCPPPVYSCDGGVTTTSGYGPGPSVPNSCATVRCPRGQSCRMQQVRCIRSPCYPVPTCQ